LPLIAPAERTEFILRHTIHSYVDFFLAGLIFLTCASRHAISSA
jgi:hypothetical protein